MSSAAYFVADFVCPTIGAILSTLTFAAPIKSLKACIKNGSLGTLNPTPWAFMTGNTIGWLAYSYITLDLFVFFANAPGLLISIWLNVGAMKLQYYEEVVKHSSIQLTESQSGESAVEGDANETRSANNGAESDDVEHTPQSLTTHELKVLQIVVIWVVILSVTSLLPMISKEDMKFVVGVAVNLNLIFFYAAPLSTILTVIRTKSSTSIHVWTMVMNTTNAFFWCVYSLAIQDYYILIPNGLGFCFGGVQIVLYRCYPQSSSDAVDGDGTELFLDEEGNSKADSRESETEII